MPKDHPTHKSPSGFAHLFLLFSLLVFIFVVFFVISGSNNSAVVAPRTFLARRTPTPPPPTPTPRPLDTPTPVGWKTYDSPVGFSVSYPARFYYLGSTKDISGPSSCLVSIGATGSTINLYITPFTSPGEELFFTRFPHEDRSHASFESVAIASQSSLLISIVNPETPSLNSNSAVIPKGNYALIPFWPEAKDDWEAFLSSIKIGELDSSLCPDVD